jgi:enoyl-CoA hydratase/carnithine racemase
MESGSNHISVESDAGIMWIQFCCPKAMNALSSAMLDVITEAIDLAARDDDVRCVVFIGEGQGGSGSLRREGFGNDRSPLLLTSRLPWVC